MTDFALTVLNSFAPSVFYFGEATLAGGGGVDIGTSGLTIRSGNALAHWQITIASGRSILSPSATGDTANLSGGPYSLIFSDGSRATVNIVAGAKSVASLAALKTALQTSNAVGFIIYPRASGASLGGGGDYSVDGDGDGITPVVSGVYTAPADYSAGVTTDYSGYAKGKNLSTGNHVRVMPHPNELLTISKRVQLTDAGKIRFSNIRFEVLDPNGAVSSRSATGMLQLAGAADCAVDGCIFQAHDTLSGAWDQYARRVGVYAPTSGANTSNNLIIQDCTFNDTWYGVSASGDGFCFVNNIVNYAWADALKAPSGNNGRVCWNLLINKWQPSDGTHPDFVQWSGSGRATDSTGVWVVGNVIVRGNGKPGDNDGQGLFADDIGVDAASTNVWNGWVKMGNRILCGYTNGIYFGNKTGRTNAATANCWVYWNTVLNDPTNNGVGQNTYIRWAQGRQASDSQNYNLANSNGTGGDIDVSRASGYAAYNDYLTGGVATLGPGVGSTLASAVAATNIKTGSPADTASPKVGAHQAYFNYATRTINTLPVTPPANP